MINCLLTGGTGIVGSHIIFEWLHKAIIEKTVNHLFVVIRDQWTFFCDSVYISILVQRTGMFIFTTNPAIS